MPSHDRLGYHAQSPRRVLPLLAAVLAALALGAVVGRVTARPQPQPAPDPGVAASPDDSVSVPAAPTVGYPRTEAGAVAAATAYTVALDGPAAFDARRRGQVLDAIAADDARAGLAVALAEGVGVISDGLALTPDVVADPDFVARPVPAGYRVAAFTPDTATVQVWGTAIFLVPGRQATPEAWTTVTVTLGWERQDWRLVARTSQRGPAPPQTPTPPAGAGQAINDFAAYSHAPQPR